MKKTKSILATVGVVGALVASTCFTAFAGMWVNGVGANAGKWWYNDGNGAQPKNEWRWIDGNSDGVAEYYYFDADGWMVSGKTVGSLVLNADGQWTVNGVVKTKKTVGAGATGQKGVSAAKLKATADGKQVSTSRGITPTVGATSDENFEAIQALTDSSADAAAVFSAEVDE